MSSYLIIQKVKISSDNIKMKKSKFNDINQEGSHSRIYRKNFFQWANLWGFGKKLTVIGIKL